MTERNQPIYERIPLASIILFSAVIWQLTFAAETFGADWPMWRYDAGRCAASPEELPSRLYLQWRWRLQAPRPAFPDEPRLCFDSSYEPVVMRKTMFVPSMVTDSVTAFDTDSGAEKWKLYADGPVRFAPVAWKGKVFFVSDDGCLYCVDARNGNLVWKSDGRPSDRGGRKLLGNERLISRWPARGGPVLSDGTIYFATGIFPFEGVYVYAVDAETGKEIWSNTNSGFIKEGALDHVSLDGWWRGVPPRDQLWGNVRDGGLSPQGYLAVVGDKVIVPSGRALPGLFDRRTGKLGPYASGWGGRINLPKGCWYVSGQGRYFFLGGDMYDLGTGRRLQIDPSQEYKELGEFREPVITAESIYYSRPMNEGPTSGRYRPVGIGYDRILAYEVISPKVENGKNKGKGAALNELWDFPCALKVHIKAGSRLYAGGAGIVAAVDIPQQGSQAKVSWKAEIEGTPCRMLAADGKLFAVTVEGTIYCFGPEKVEPKTYETGKPSSSSVADEWTRRAEQILKRTGVTEGYCLALGVGTGRLVEELARQSELDIIVLDPDRAKVDAARRKFDAIGLYGKRVHILVGDLLSVQLPRYMASFVVSENLERVGFEQANAFIEKLFDSVRPYGGVACLPVPQAKHAAFASAWIKEGKLTGDEAKRIGDWTLLSRKGSVPGAADWTHEGADAGNTFTSKDQLVKYPLGVLWFGGSVDRIFPDWDYVHSAGPSPLVVGGRMFILVGDDLHASDIYTGRHLWKTALPGGKIGRRQYAYNNYVAAEDGIYVVCGKTCLRLDPATGSTLGQIDVPEPLRDEQFAPWREVRLWKDRLVGTTGRHLVCMNRYSGKPLWRFQCRCDRLSFAIGNDKVFCVDHWLPKRQRRGTKKTTDRILAFDARSGAELWDVNIKVSSGKPFEPILPQLGYCDVNDVLILTAYNETVCALEGGSGKLLWSKKIISNIPTSLSLSRPPILHRKILLTHGGRLHDPLTGSELPRHLWKWMGEDIRGCGRAVASEHIVTLRDAFASYFDLATGRQVFLRGVRSGCTNSLIPAGGLLSSPNFARGCSCNYPVFTSLALVHMPEAAKWSPPASEKIPVKLP